jgi:putative phosphoesterase
MLIAVLSDSHSDFKNIELALARLRGSGVEHVFHCGDIDRPAAASMFADLPTTFVFGNVDSDFEGICQAIEQSGNRCCGRLCDVEVAGRKIAMQHGDDARSLRSLELSGRYDFLFYGHTHVAEQHSTGPTLVVNPGALHRARTKSLALIDLGAKSCEIVPLAATGSRAS